MSFVRIWVHVVFSTKNREPWLRKEIRPVVFRHMAENCEQKKIFLQAINGYEEHVHALMALGSAQSIAKVVQQLKGESALWINRQNLVPEKFNWQDDYFAVSVSESQLEAVMKYIKNQEAHHRRKSFIEEAEAFNRRFGYPLPVR